MHKRIKDATAGAAAELMTPLAGHAFCVFQVYPLL